MEELVSADRKPVPEGQVTFEEFIAWSTTNTFAEWEDGYVISRPSETYTHQDMCGWLRGVLGIYIRHNELGDAWSRVFIRLRKANQVREPDFVFVKTKHYDRLYEDYLDGPADLVVEVISPESISRDRGRKFVEYEQEGISEYWLIDPIRQQAEFYQLGEDGHYHPALPDADGIYHSAGVDGFWLRVSWLWEKPLPSALSVLRELGIS